MYASIYMQCVYMCNGGFVVGTIQAVCVGN